MKMKKFIAVLSVATMAAGLAVGCGSSDSGSSDDKSSKGDWDSSNDITIVSREDGSGTRGAFIELFGIEEKKDGEKVDMTTDDAQITNSTSVMLQKVAQTKSAIGYVSLGSLSTDVKAVQVDGVDATAENVKSGDYKVSRPFNICYKEDKLSDIDKDFISFIMSKEGQQIVNDNGYIGVEATESYKASGKKGKITLAGSTSVAPLMDKLKDEYVKLNADASIEIQESGSSAGIQSAIEGATEIGMSSRELKDEEAKELQVPILTEEEFLRTYNIPYEE